MNTDKVTTWLGFAGGLLTEVATSLKTGFDPHNPVTWIGVVGGVIIWAQGYFTNKQSVPAVK